MRQVARRLKDGRLELLEVPDPAPQPGSVTVQVDASIVSSGTERATLEVARAGLVAKARARPDQARQVVERARREGVRSTVALVRQRLEELGPLGYSAAGTALEVGAQVRGIVPGDRVAIGGGGFANHAEIDVVPSLLCAKVPADVEIEDAAFATLGAVALNGFRRSDADVGATVAVIGLGLIGQLAVRVARAAGCRVLGVDLEEDLVALARTAGADAHLRSQIEPGSRQEGVAHAVLVCASSRSSDPVELAALLARDRGVVVVVGDVATDIPRAAYYEKELDLRLARSYGPGRYDADYELHGLDYPEGFVRWTEQRNMEAFLSLVSDGSVRPSELVTHRFPFSEAEAAFETLSSERPIAIALSYRSAEGDRGIRKQAMARAPADRSAGDPGAPPRFGIIGAGAFATSTLIPGLIDAGLAPAVVASSGGLSAESARRRFGFEVATGDPEEVLARNDLALLVIATRHDSHAALAAEALRAGLPVYVEKPLTLDWEGLRVVHDAQLASGMPLVVGFNRRHAPLARELEQLPGPRLMSYRVNAGPLAADHWLNDPLRGGGRLKGEGVHFIDFLCRQAGSDPLRVFARGFPSRPDLGLEAADNFAVEIEFADGGLGSLHYAADAPTAAGKERFETSAPGVFAFLDDFSRGELWQRRDHRRLGRGRQDKGFAAQFGQLARHLRGEEEWPAPESYYVSTIATLAAARSLASGRPEPVVGIESEDGQPAAQLP